VLGRRRDAPDFAQARPLEAAHARLGVALAQVHVLPRPLDDAPPPRVARDIHHRREGPHDSIGRRLGGGDARRTLGGLGAPGARLAERHGKDRPVAVDDVEREEQRDASRRLLDRDPLQRSRRVRADDVQEGADLAAPELRQPGRRAARPRRLADPRELVELPELLEQRHPAEHRVHEVLLGRIANDARGRRRRRRSAPRAA
jgi:hypothetical protein